MLRLLPYRFKVKYAPGDQNAADALSRLINPDQIADEDSTSITEEYVKFVGVNAAPMASKPLKKNLQRIQK